MADNTTITPGTGVTVATDDIAGVQVQRVKVTWGVDGTMTDANATTPLPVTLGASINSNGQATMANSAPVVIASNQTSVPVTATGTVSITDISNAEYETVAASATAQVLGATGATGDYISGVLIIPATTSPGSVVLLDNATSITIFTGGATSLSNLVPFFVPLGMKSVSGAWKITTGTNVSCIGIGNFT